MGTQRNFSGRLVSHVTLETAESWLEAFAVYYNSGQT
jgi:hypothetical protein